MNIKIGQLPAVVSINGSDLLPLETSSYTGKITIDQLGNNLISLITRYKADNITLGLDEDTNTFYVLASYLPLSGGTMVGSLILSGNPTTALEAATKSYVDDTANTLRSEGANNFVRKIGDTMSGLLTLSGPPTANLHAVTKAYADGKFVNKAGDTMTGALAINSTLNVQDGSTFRGDVTFSDMLIKRFRPFVKTVDLNSITDSYTVLPEDNGSVIIIRASAISYVKIPNTLTVGFNLLVIKKSLYTLSFIPAQTQGAVDIVNVFNRISIGNPYGVCNMICIDTNQVLISGDLI